MHLNSVIYGLSSHEAAWRMPESDPHALTKLSFWIDHAQRAEAAGFDACSWATFWRSRPGRQAFGRFEELGFVV
jgi:hypothetical protein